MESRKTIIIKTTRELNNEGWSRFFSEELNYRRHISEIGFSDPITNPRGNLNSKLTLKTAWFSKSFDSNPYWMQMLDDEEHYNLLSSDIFEQFRGDFTHYSESRLKDWQEAGLKRHKKVLDQIEEIYTFGERGVLIPKDLFSL